MPGAFPRPMSSSISPSPSCDALRRETWVGTSTGGPLLSTPWESRRDRSSPQSRNSRGSQALPCIPCSPGRGSSTSTTPGRFIRGASDGAPDALHSGTNMASPPGSRSSGGSRSSRAARSIVRCYRTLVRAAGSLSRFVNKKVPAGVCTNCRSLLYKGDPLLPLWRGRTRFRLRRLLGVLVRPRRCPHAHGFSPR